MRKHFLILMLLTLLPFTAWAQGIDISEFPFTMDSQTYPYEGATPALDHPKVMNTSLSTPAVLDPANYDLVYFIKDGTTYTEVAAAQVATNVKNAGSYAVAARGKGSYTGTTNKIDFVITPLALTIKGNAASKTYGQNDPAAVYTPLASAAISDGVNDLTATFAGKITFSRVTGDHYVAAGYAINATITDATLNKNYTIASADIKNSDASASAKFMINQKALPAWGSGANQATLTVTGNTTTFSGAPQTATVTIRDNALNKDLRAADFEVVYDGAANQTNYKAGGYTITVKLKAAGDYSGADRDLTQKFVINKKTLKVYVNDIEKVYDGTTDIPTTATFGYSGLVGADAGEATPFGAIYDAAYAGTPTGDEKYVGEYNLVPELNGTAPSGNYANYDISFLSTGTLTVNQRPLTITADNKSKSYGTNDPAFTKTLQALGENVGIIGADAGTVSGAYKVVRSNSDIEAVGNYTGVLVPTQKADAEISLDPVVLAGVKKVLAQYAITPVNGNFTINAASLTVYPKAKTITYGTTYTLADFEIVAVNTGGKKVTLTTSPTVHIKSYADDDLPTDAGIYTLVLQGTAAAPGYSSTPEFLEAQFTIAKKDLTITPKAQTVHVGDTKAALALYNTDDSKVTFTGLVGEDKIKYELDFNTVDATPLDGKIPTFAQDAADAVNYTKASANTYNAANVAGCVATGFTVTSTSTPNLEAVNAVLETDVAENDVLTVEQAYEYNCSKAGAKTTADVETPAKEAVTKGIEGGALLVAATYAKGIKVTPIDLDPNDEDDDVYANNNYNIIVANQTAALTVVAAATFVMDDTDADLNAKIEAAHNTTGNSITFSSREIKAGQWNTLVLPFDTSVEEISEKFGYAVVDVLNESNTSESNVSLVLAFNALPANKPFLVQPKADKNMNTITFTGKKIVYSANPVATDGGNHSLVGVYTMGKKVSSADKTEYYYNTTQKKFVNGGTTGTAINPMRAYLKDNSSAGVREFSIQEPNGQTTVITNVNAETEFNTNEVYDIRGMKMQNVPTEKGVYIINGKKVVIK